MVELEMMFHLLNNPAPVPAVTIYISVIKITDFGLPRDICCDAFKILPCDIAHQCLDRFTIDGCPLNPYRDQYQETL